MKTLTTTLRGNALTVASLMLFTFGVAVHAATYREQKIIEGFPKVFAPQEDTQWCWAACVQMVLNFRGHKFTQEEIVEQAFGGVVNEPTNLDRICKSLNLKNDDGSVVLNTAITDPFGDLDTVEQLDRGNLIIAAVSQSIGEAAHHVVIIYGYRIDTDNKVWLDVWDPWPKDGGGAKTVCYGEDFFWQKTILVTFPDEPAPKSVIDPKAESRLVRDTFDLDQLKWTTTYPERIVSYKVGYANQDPTRSVRFKLVLRTGTIPHLGDKSDWVPHESKQVEVVLPPLSHTNLTGSLDWFGATPERMPKFNETITSCQFEGGDGDSTTSAIGIDSFSSFAGFTNGQKEQDVINLLGRPESSENDDDSIDLYYFDNGLTFFCDKKTKRIRSIVVREIDAVNSLRALGIKDDKLSFINDFKSDILATFGDPTMKSSAVIYERRTDNLKISVSFGIKSYDADKCYSITVSWHFYQQSE